MLPIEFQGREQGLNPSALPPWARAPICQTRALGSNFHGSHINSGRVSSPFPQPLPPRPRNRHSVDGGLASQVSLPLRPGDAGRSPPAEAAIFPLRPTPTATRRHRGTRPHLSSQSLHFTCSGTSCWNRTWLMLDRCPALRATSNGPGPPYRRERRQCPANV